MKRDLTSNCFTTGANQGTDSTCRLQRLICEAIDCEVFGTLRRDAFDENKDCKNTVGVISKNNCFARLARAYCILVHFFDVLVLTTA